MLNFSDNHSVSRRTNPSPLYQPRATMQSLTTSQSNQQTGLGDTALELKGGYKDNLYSNDSDKILDTHQHQSQAWNQVFWTPTDHTGQINKEDDYSRHYVTSSGSSTGHRSNSRLSERRSLDLENTRGGAGAPVKDPWGENRTRMPITLSRDDYGESNIKEDVPGKINFSLDFTDQDNKPFYPWGGQGGGAPLRDRDGKVVTQVYGKLERRYCANDDVSMNRRRQEILYQDLKECARQQKENKQEQDRYMKKPHKDLAEMMLSSRVGKPRKDNLTGEIAQQHLPNSDVSKIKMNYQPVPVSEKKLYHDELVKMAEERQQQRELDRLKDRQESNAHFQNMDSTWGAYGGGAPKHRVIRKKVNLLNSLFYPGQVRVESHNYDKNIHRPEDLRYEKNIDELQSLYQDRHIDQPESLHHDRHSYQPQDFVRNESDHNPPTGLGSFQHYKAPRPTLLQRGYSEQDYTRPLNPLTDNVYQSNLGSPLRSSHRNLFDNPRNLSTRGSSGGLFAPYATGGRLQD